MSEKILKEYINEILGSELKEAQLQEGIWSAIKRWIRNKLRKYVTGRTTSGLKRDDWEDVYSHIDNPQIPQHHYGQTGRYPYMRRPFHSKDEDLIRKMKKGISAGEYNQEDASVIKNFVIPLLRKTRVKKAQTSAYSYNEDDMFDNLYEEIEEIIDGPSPIPISSAYLEKDQVMDRVQELILNMAPTGLQSQNEFTDILNMAIKQAQKEFYAKANGLDERADFDLTLSMAERTLRSIPYYVFFAAKQK